MQNDSNREWMGQAQPGMDESLSLDITQYEDALDHQRHIPNMNQYQEEENKQAHMKQADKQQMHMGNPQSNNMQKRDEDDDDDENGDFDDFDFKSQIKGEKENDAMEMYQDESLSRIASVKIKSFDWKYER